MIGDLLIPSSAISVQFYYGLGMYRATLYNQIMDACGNFSAWSKKCSDILDVMNNQVGQFYIYKFVTSNPTPNVV